MLGTFGRAGGSWEEAAGASRLQILIWCACSALIGLLLLGAPTASTMMIVTIVAVCWLLGGIASAVAAVWKRESHWGWHFAGAAVAVLASLFVLAHPFFSALVAVESLFVVLAVSMLVSGGVALVSSHSVGSAILGVALLGVGCMMLFAPFHVVALVSLVQWIGLLCVAGSLLAGVSTVVGHHPATPS